MDQETEIIPLDELPFEVDVEKWDAFRGAEPICPGLYLMETRHGGCFVVLKEWAEKIFSSEALAYGTEDGNAVYFPTHDGKYGDQVIRYEIGRHMALLGRPFSAYDPLYVQALYGSEEAPGYFGAPVPPVDTPRGRMTRYLELDKGIFLLETDHCAQMLAVSYPIWNAELSSAVHAMAEMTEYDRSTGIDLTMGYLFFSRELCAAPLYELMQNQHSELEGRIISKTALISAIWKQSPAYAVAANMQEQMGMGAGNLLYHLAGALGVDAPELEQPPKDFIPYIKNAEDTEFLQLPDSWHIDKAISGRVRD